MTNEKKEQIKNLIKEHNIKFWVEYMLKNNCTSKEVEEWFDKQQKELNVSDEEMYSVLKELCDSGEFEETMEEVCNQIKKYNSKK